jgi:rhodanese-related sulfurtransferase
MATKLTSFVKKGVLILVSSSTLLGALLPVFNSVKTSIAYAAGANTNKESAIKKGNSAKKDDPKKQESQTVIIDVRTPEEFQSGHVPKALNIDIYNPQFEAEIAKLDREKKYILYCRSGARASRALQLMRNMGFKDVENYGGLSSALSRLNVNCEGC